jgi:hypothetical protein
MILDLCDQLLKELEIARSPLPSYFQPGISKQAVDDLLRKSNVKVSLPDDVYSLYQWRNGLDDDKVKSKAMGEVQLFKLAVFNSLDMSIKTYQYPDVRQYSSSKSLFPLFESSAGDFYFIDTDEKSDTYRMIIFFSFSNPYILNGASIFDSLENCIITVTECYRNRAYYYVPGISHLEIQPKLEISIWENNNPNSEYYKIMRNS